MLDIEIDAKSGMCFQIRARFFAVHPEDVKASYARLNARMQVYLAPITSFIVVQLLVPSH